MTGAEGVSETEARAVACGSEECDFGAGHCRMGFYLVSCVCVLVENSRLWSLSLTADNF